MISIVLVTYNRKLLLQQCLHKVLGRISPLTEEIIIWNNASTDGTGEVLNGLSNSRVKIIHSPQNIGTNAFAQAFSSARGDHFIELDDDVIDAPDHWDKTLVNAFLNVPNIGFLAANVVDDGKSTASEIMYRRDRHLYRPTTVNGVDLLLGPTGGWCTMTSAAVYKAVGGFATDNRFVYWHEDAAYVKRVQRHGLQAAILASLKVLHASGPAYSQDPVRTAEKDRYDSWRLKRARRRHAIKRVLDKIAPVRALNRKLGLYHLTDRDPV